MAWTNQKSRPEVGHVNYAGVHAQRRGLELVQKRHPEQQDYDKLGAGMLLRLNDADRDRTSDTIYGSVFMTGRTLAGPGPLRF